jgi:alpha-galactosidase/6-phospho-beta-glucosidase family protein
VQASEVQADYLGVNHLGWFFNIRSGSRGLENGLGDKLAAADERSFPNSQFLRTQGCFPTRYLRMHYEPDKVLAEQTSQRAPRAEVLSDIQRRSYETYRNDQLNEIVSALEGRATPWYTQAVGPLLLALAGHRVEIPFFLSGENGAYVPSLAPDDIIECRQHWSEGGLLRSPLTSEPPKHVVENLVPFVQFERIATEAIMSRNTALLKEALSLHPWTKGHARLPSIVDEIVTANDAMLMATTRG